MLSRGSTEHPSSDHLLYLASTHHREPAGHAVERRHRPNNNFRMLDGLFMTNIHRTDLPGSIGLIYSNLIVSNRWWSHNTTELTGVPRRNATLTIQPSHQWVDPLFHPFYVQCSSSVGVLHYNIWSTSQWMSSTKGEEIQTEHGECRRL